MKAMQWVFLIAALSVSAYAHAAAEQFDGCDHGSTGKQCRADVQADHGQDCLRHGAFKEFWPEGSSRPTLIQVGGSNENHCLMIDPN